MAVVHIAHGLFRHNESVVAVRKVGGHAGSPVPGFVSGQPVPAYNASPSLNEPKMRSVRPYATQLEDVGVIEITIRTGIDLMTLRA